MSLESILAGLADDETRGQFSAVLEKNPGLKTFVEVGERFQPVVAKFGDRFTQIMTQLEAVDPTGASEDFVRLPEWIKYHRENWDPQANRYKNEAAALEEAARLRTELAELRAKGEVGDMDLQEVTKAIEEKLKAEGFVRREDLVGKDGNSGLLIDSVNRNAAHIERIYRALTPKIVSHQQTFGKEMPMDAVIDYIAKNPGIDPNAAYEAVVAPERAALLQKEHAAAVAKAREEGVTQGKTEAMQAMGKPGMPVSSGGSASGRSSFMQRIFARREERSKGVVDGRLGSGEAARKGFEDWSKKQMAGGSV